MVRLDRDQYFCPLVFSESKRRSEYALPTHVLWADLDTADPAKLRLRPSASWQTTQGVFPHWQALWFLKVPYRGKKIGLTERQIAEVDAQWGHVREKIPAEEAAQLSRRIPYAESADKGGWDVTQVLRLPGTRNHKHSPPHRIELLWAERRYYTVEQVEAAYPPVPVASTNGGTGWGEFTDAQVAQALATLPMGVQMGLERGGGDRSLELIRMSRTLLGLGIETALIPHLLRTSPLNKFRGRSDEKQRLLAAVTDAMLG